MNIFVTGGAGYIGSIMVDKLLNAGHSTTVYDSLVTGHKEAVHKGAKFIHADLSDMSALDNAVSGEKFDVIMHFAAFIEAGDSMKSPGLFFKNNLVNSLNLVELAHIKGISKFILSSTAAVYSASEDLLSEESPIDPANPYGFTKLVIEQTLEWYRRIYGMGYASLRYFNACGAVNGRGEAHIPETHLIPLILKVALGQLPEVKIFGTDYPTQDGTCIRDYIHIYDLASAHLLVLEALKSTDSMVYNLGNGNGFSVRQVIETAQHVTGRSIPAVEVARRLGDAPRLVASSEKIRRELGWMPKYSDLNEIITNAWDWHQSHPYGYES